MSNKFCKCSSKTGPLLISSRTASLILFPLWGGEWHLHAFCCSSYKFGVIFAFSLLYPTCALLSTKVMLITFLLLYGLHPGSGQWHLSSASALTPQSAHGTALGDLIRFQVCCFTIPWTHQLQATSGSLCMLFALPGMLLTQIPA